MFLCKQLVHRPTLLLLVTYTMAEGHRPLLRSKLAQSVYNRMLMDEKLKNMDFSSNYQVKTFLLNPSARDRYVPSEMDIETKTFIDACFDQSDYIILQIWHSLAKGLLSMFMSRTSVNGLLNRGRMFVWSKEQAKVLLSDSKRRWKIGEDSEGVENSSLGPRVSSLNTLTNDVDNRKDKDHAEGCKVSSDGFNYKRSNTKPEEDVYEDAHESICSSPSTSSSLKENLELLSSASPSDSDRLEPWWSGKVVLDLGAGDGHVTQILGDSAKEVYATETSPVMRKRLSYRGYKILDAFTWAKEAENMTFDLITCLNLLDRCDKPVTLLKDIHSRLSPDGKLVVALVLPIDYYVETGSDDHVPSEDLGITGDTIENQVNCSIEEVFPKFGFTVDQWSRLPYLSEGDLDQAFYWLSDIVFILSKTKL